MRVEKEVDPPTLTHHLDGNEKVGDRVHLEGGLEWA